MSTEIIEHVVMLNITEEDPLKLDALMKSMNALSSLPEVLYLTAGPILRPHKLPGGLHFTHLLHGRYSSLSDLNSYNTSAPHLSLFAKLKPILADYLILDWAWPTLLPNTKLLPGQALRFTSFKLKDGHAHNNGNGKDEILKGLSKIKGAFEEMTYDEEVSIDNAKGFKVAAVAVFHDLKGLEASKEYEHTMRSLIDHLKDIIDVVIFVDYVVPLSCTTDSSNVVVV